MDARTFSQLMLANATLVIDRQGQIRELVAGAVPAPGEVVVTVGDGANPQVTAEEVPGSEQGALNLNFDEEIAQIIGQLEQGADPTLNEDQATAAGGANGSALGNSGTVVMQLASIIAATAFSTSGYSRESLSETQSLNEDLVEDEPPVSSVPPVALDIVQPVVTPQAEPPQADPIDSETSRSYEEQNQPIVETLTLDFQLGEGEQPPVFDSGIGPFVVDGFGSLSYINGEWVFEAASAFNELNVDDEESGQFVVTDTEGGTHVVNVTITGTNDAPVFTGTVSPQSFDVFGEEQQVANSYSQESGYIFHYYENHQDDAIGRITATDVDDEDTALTYQIIDGEGENDTLYSDYFTIDSQGYIYLTALGKEAFTNDFEAAQNIHELQVKVSDPAGAFDLVTVTLKELEVDTPPEANSFTQSVMDNSEIQIVFDNDGKANDHISDIEDDDPQGEVLGIVIGELPENGTLWYLDPDTQVKRALGEEDLGLTLDPKAISYVANLTSESFVLADNLDLLSAVHLTGNSSKAATVVWQESNPSDNSGTGVGVSSSENGQGGQGIGKAEVLTLDLSSNLMASVSYTLEGINPNHGASVTYSYLLDGETVTQTVAYDENSAGYEESSQTIQVSYQAPEGGAITQVDFTSLDNGSNYTVSEFEGSGVPTVQDDSFTYKAIDSEDQLSQNDNGENGYSVVTLDAYETQIADSETGYVEAKLGADIMQGDEQANIFAWLDTALDNSSDIVKNFEFGVDKIDLTSILDDDPNTTNIDDLMSQIEVTDDGTDVTLTVAHGENQQVIVIEDGVTDYIDTYGGDFDATIFLTDVLKTTATESA